MTRQNTWLVNNIFDPKGNYLHCMKCVCLAFGVNKKRLARLRDLKVKGESNPVITLEFGPSRGKLCLVVICQPGTLTNSTGHSQKRQPGRCIQGFGPRHPPNTPMLYPNISFADTPPPQKKRKFFNKIKK